LLAYIQLILHISNLLKMARKSMLRTHILSSQFNCNMFMIAKYVVLVLFVSNAYGENIRIFIVLK